QVDASVGWSGLLAGEVGNLSVVEDSLFEAENISVCADWTWQRNGVIAGVFKGLVRNIVSIKTGDDQMIGTIPYGYNNGSDAFASMYNVYTNVPASIAKTFDASGSHEWGMIGSDGVEIFSDFGDFSSSTSTDFALDPAIWTLADGAMPHLAHFGETALTMGPEVEASVSKSSILVAEVATVTATLKNSEEVPTWSFVASEGYASVATIVQDSVEANKFNVTGVALGTITVKIVATIGGVDYESSELTFNVIEEGSYEIPTDAVEISTYAEFISFFDGSAANTTKNAVLTADIVGDNTLRGFGMAGEYSGIFEGQGHTISNYKTSQGLFNILGATAEVRNVNFELNHTGSGFGTIAYQNNGLISNCQITVTIDGAQNTFGGVTLVGTSGTFVDCHVSFIINNSQCNTLYPICQNDGTVDITNCSYSFAGSDGSAIMFSTSNTNITLVV
ncbi:MAG: hypothetical protein M0P07_07815, partial [Candidatus Methanomethylophilaceae archaeon]|nr:hypothetical protein [Candidatus Methanomethylophilaceae archaeon]